MNSPAYIKMEKIYAFYLNTMNLSSRLPLKMKGQKQSFWSNNETQLQDICTLKKKENKQNNLYQIKAYLKKI